MARRKQDSLIPFHTTDSAYVEHVLDHLEISQAALAKLLGLSQGQVSKILAGVHKTHPSTVRLLGLITEVPGVLTWLITAQELLYGPIPEGKRPQPYLPSGDRETAPWPDED